MMGNLRKFINLPALIQFDMIEFARPLFAQGWFIDAQSKKITANHAIDPNRKWIYTNPDPERMCDVYRHIFDMCGFIPSYCLNSCWKVVVKLKTVEQLFQLLEWQLEYIKGREKKSRFCKCGIEERAWVTYPYGGYFYCKTKTAGLKRYKDVRAAMDLIDPDIVVILKRYCTEFEIKTGPSGQYQQPEIAPVMEKKIFSAIDRKKGNPKQPGYLIDHIFREWLEFAYDRGDMTCLQFNGGNPFYPPTQTYHEVAK